MLKAHGRKGRIKQMYTTAIMVTVLCYDTPELIKLTPSQTLRAHTAPSFMQFSQILKLKINFGKYLFINLIFGENVMNGWEALVVPGFKGL